MIDTFYNSLIDSNEYISKINYKIETSNPNSYGGYTGKTFAENLYSSMIRSVPIPTHFGKYD